MDMDNYTEKRFNEVKEEVTKLLKTVGYKVDLVQFIPISSLMGENVVKKSTHMPWYNGPTVCEALSTFADMSLYGLSIQMLPLIKLDNTI